ncbi:uncharacterized protein LOC123500947 [Portunus trituberculatus]|uniref:uncharacterized protein LOC123500947 n=1 Tax=Portunus trituberculatus TaxID=210409 RepID=UPI001E1D048F|nr:uncharacterized protein LOC123500947 [Portunus trituberculatus]
MNSALTFTEHVRTITKIAAWKLSCIRRVSHFLDYQGISTLYAAQVRPLMVYAPRLKAPPDQPSPTMQPLQQRRDLAGLCVIFKTHKQGAPHLTALRQPWAQPHGHTTRAATSRVHHLVVPFARTETFLRSFLPRYTRMWNHLVMQTQLHYTTSLHTFKYVANA